MIRRPISSRRQFLKAAGGAAASMPALSGMGEETSKREATPEVFYSNDTTHILSCVSPWRTREDRASGFTDDHLRASISEAADADVHLLQPGLGWIPWWDSKVYSPQEHYGEFLAKHGITKIPPIGRYLLEGGDMVRTLVEHCRKIGVQPFVSLRLNDGHHVRKLASALEKQQPAPEMARHFWENYEAYRIGPDPTDWAQGVFDWSIPEVRDYKFSLIEELVSRYQIDGIELDFVRHWSRFAPDRTTVEDRRSITTQFVARVRKAIDASSQPAQSRRLCLRIPANLEIHDDQGIDVGELVAAGVDVITLSFSYFTMQDDVVRRLRETHPEVTILLEMTHTTLTGKATAGSGTQPYLRTTAQQFYTTAELAYRQGANGVSLFNFPYYREHKMPELGPFHEPPFEILPRLRDRKFLARQSQWAFLSAGRNDPVLGTRPLRAILQRNEPQTFLLQMAPRQLHHNDGVLRLRSDEPIADRTLSLRFNEMALERIPFVAKPLPHPYETWLGSVEEFQCFALPAGLAKPGANQIEIELIAGIRVRLYYLDATLPA